MTARILLVEDDPTISKLLVGDLQFEGYTVHLATDGLSGLEKAKELKPDLIILDIALPKMNGYDVCRTLRRDGQDVAILMLTARGQETDKVVGLDYGADDYVTKPYGLMELLARIKALLRRRGRQRSKLETARFGDIAVDFKRMTATKGRKSLDLTAKEFQMLELLIRQEGEVVSRQQFLEEVWGYDDSDLPNTRTVDNRMLSLRQKLNPADPEAFIATVHGTGYKFVGRLA